MKLSVRSKLRSQIALTILLTLIMVWAMAFYELRRSKRGVIQEAELQTASSAHIFSEYSLSNIKRLNEFILNIRTNWDGDWKSFAAHVQNRQENISDLAFQVGVIDRDGILAFSNLAKPNERVDLSQREHFRVHANAPQSDKLFISKPLKSKVSGKWSIQFTRPIFTDGYFAGVIVLSVSPELFGNFYNKLDIGQDSVLAIVRDSGEFMARYPEVESTYTQVVKNRIYLEPNSAINGNWTSLAVIAGGEKIFGYHKLPEYNLNFVIGKSMETVLAPYEHYRNTVIGLGLAASSIALCLFFILNRSLFQLQRVERELISANEQVVSSDTASKAKSAFLAHMSHEIRTPLNIIIGIGELLSLEITNTRQRRKLNQLRATSDHLLALITDILDLSKIEAGQLVLETADFHLEHMVEAVIRLFKEQAREKELVLTLDLDLSFHSIMLCGDSLRLSQVLINLVGNAIKFTERGSVILSISCINDMPERVTLRFSVTDTGCGISPDNKAKLFLPFTQGDASTTRRYGGTGLGLAISKRLVRIMGGSLLVDSKLGAGSTFSFEIDMPRGKGLIEQPALAAPAASAFAGKHILLVDDHVQSREILFEMLETFGCEIDTASDGAEAVERLRAHDYDVVLMDCQMPRMDGLEATRLIRSLPGWQTTPIIALTADAFAEDRESCLAAGMSAHLGKPVTLEKLAAVLAQWLPNTAVTPKHESLREALVDNELSRTLMLISGIEIPSIWRSSEQQTAHYCSLLKKFIHTAKDEVNQLITNLAAGDQNAARALAHQIRGFAGFVGAQRVASLIGEVDRGLRAGINAATVNYLVSECESEIKRLSNDLEKLPMANKEAINK